MAKDDWDAPGYFDEVEAQIYYDMTEHLAAGLKDEFLHDEEYQLYYHDALFADNISPDLRAAIYEEMTNYFDRYYDEVFEEVFDWDDYREWYDAQ